MVMFDDRYLAFATLSALLVVTPGATLAVVVETALGNGRRAALCTVVGIGMGNATLMLATSLGLSGLLAEWPEVLPAVKTSWAVYLCLLGLRGIWVATRSRSADGRSRVGPGTDERSGSRGATGSAVFRGVLTNLLNPSVILFYATIPPQFVSIGDPVPVRLLVLGATHVVMSIVWHGTCGLAVGAAAEHLRRPSVRRALDGLTGAVLVGLGARLLAK